jgi:hypothetical protein
MLSHKFLDAESTTFKGLASKLIEETRQKYNCAKYMRINMEFRR